MDKTPAVQVLAENLRWLMERRPDLNTQIKVAKKADVAQTSVSQMLNIKTEARKSPKLDQVEKIAGAFGLAVWQLLLDHKTVGKDLADLLMRPAIKDDDPKLTNWKSPHHPEDVRATAQTSRYKKNTIA